MKILTLTLFLVLITSGLFAQKSRSVRKPVNHSQVAKQGICGTVVEKRGNHMPGPDRPTPTGRPVERDVLIYPVLTTDQVTATDDGFYSNIPGQPVKTVRSDKQGRFCVYGLPAGTYSVLVREPKGLYANLLDIDGRINPITVKKQRVANVAIQITHQAVF